MIAHNIFLLTSARVTLKAVLHTLSGGFRFALAIAAALSYREPNWIWVQLFLLRAVHGLKYINRNDAIVEQTRFITDPTMPEDINLGGANTLPTLVCSQPV